MIKKLPENYQGDYTYRLKCNGVKCSRATTCLWYYVKPKQAYEFIRAPYICNQYVELPKERKKK